jgi:hypothetical protein
MSALQTKRYSNTRVAFRFNVSRSLEASTDLFGWLSNSISTQPFLIHTRDFDVDINAIEQRA